MEHTIQVTSRALFSAVLAGLFGIIIIVIGNSEDAVVADGSKVPFLECKPSFRTSRGHKIFIRPHGFFLLHLRHRSACKKPRKLPVRRFPTQQAPHYRSLGNHPVLQKLANLRPLLLTTNLLSSV